MNLLLWLSILAMIAPYAASAAERRTAAAGSAPVATVYSEIPASRGSHGTSFVPWAFDPQPGAYDRDWEPDDPSLDFESEALLLLPIFPQDHPPGPPRDRRGRPMPPPGAMPGRRPGLPPMLPPPLMQRLRDLSPEEQEKVLKNNQRFQELPKEQQEMLLRRLRRFQELTPEQREMIRQRFEAFRKLTPEQRQRAREIYQEKWQALPQERRKAIVEEFRKMREMFPEDRDKYLASPDVENRFSAEERELLKQLGTFAPPPPPRFGGPPRHFGPPPGPPPEPLLEPRP